MEYLQGSLIKMKDANKNRTLNAAFSNSQRWYTTSLGNEVFHGVTSSELKILSKLNKKYYILRNRESKTKIADKIETILSQIIHRTRGEEK